MRPRPLLILACSQTKRAPAAADALIPFIDLYDGPMWRQVRASGIAHDRIAAISARHGFLAPGTAIADYDEAMTETRLIELAGVDQARRMTAAIAAAGGAFIVGGATYRAFAKGALMLQPCAGVTYAEGSFLALRRELGTWLRANAEPRPATWSHLYT